MLGKISVMQDERINCISVMTTISIRSYMEVIRKVYADRGGIDGQRDALKTTSAIRIRRRMVEDIKQGAILPPIVLGLVLNESDFRKFSSKTLTAPQRKRLILGAENSSWSIIDGMQRTTAIFEAFSSKSPAIDKHLRIEFWVSNAVGNLIYRMLVLNTGQVPWNLRRQVEVVYSSLILDLRKNVNGLVIKGERERRVNGGDFQGNELVELYLVFGARKETVDVKEKLADEFTRLDFMEVAENVDFSLFFKKSLECLVRLDKAFDRRGCSIDKSYRFCSGKDIFASQPACVGFMTAIAVNVFGRPGVHKGIVDQEKAMNNIESRIAKVCEKISLLMDEDFLAFICLDILSDSLPKSRGSSSIGNSEREYFFKAFQVLLDNKADFDTLETCWRAY